MMIFQDGSPKHTIPALLLAFEKANELKTDIILPTTTGASAIEALKHADSTNFQGKIIVVTHVWGMKSTGENELLEVNSIDSNLDEEKLLMIIIDILNEIKSKTKFNISNESIEDYITYVKKS